MLRRSVSQCARRWAIASNAPLRSTVRYESTKPGNGKDASSKVNDARAKAEQAFIKMKTGASQAMESDFAKQARAATEELNKAARENTKQFFEKEGEDGKTEQTEAGKAANKAANVGGDIVSKLKSGFAYMVDAYKEEFRLAQMSEKDIEREQASARAAARAAEEAKAEAEAKARGENWTPSEETAVMVQKVKQSAWEKRWGWFKEHAERTKGGKEAFSRFQKLKSSPFITKSKERLEDIRERWETSDSPVVHRLQEMHENLTTESESALAIKAIRKRDPKFDTVRFMARLKEDIPIILSSYLQGDLAKLKQLNVGEEMVERMGGQIAAWKAEGSIVDSQILDTSDMEMVEMKMFGENPIIILRCVCQQINCVRNKAGEVVEGAPDDIQSVHYGWAMEQNPAGSGVDGAPPQWIVREMMVQGMQAIV